ncbi:alpha/beta fold hydrolase [Breznakiella homolactica]|uniref:Alpha/beta hydrolase n=1 Tax=Breznakiella homolactica TaxID=2798577 RepID=A0A7T7XM15_9SPIR|nr:alpha/beta hydrolase [Breznakiella homolactica]QQO08742.1 alpha/beta hydrolase [Breznakiella homolactica]
MEVNVNGVTLYYKKTGSGPALVLLHGNGEDHTIFDELTEKLKDRFTLYAPDSRNHGRSEQTEVYAYETMAEDIFQFIKKLDLAPVYLLGFSDGGIIGLLLAMKHPEVLRKAALLGVNLKPEDFTEESYAYVKETYEQTGDPLFKLMLEQPDIPLEALRDVHVPLLLMAGENDIYRPELYRDLVRTLPDARLITMEGHDHSSYIEHSDLIGNDVRAFFEESRQKPIP